MSIFVPTLGIKDTSQNVRNFVDENKDVFWDVFKPLMPYIVTLFFIDTVLAAFFNFPFPIGQIISSYFMMALIITWHRVVIHGRDNYVPVNPLAPKKSELMFIGMGVFLSLAGILAIFSFTYFGALLGKPVAFVGAFVSVVLFIFMIFRFSFYFPAKATGAPITLAQSYRMSGGYCVKIFIANLRATFRLLILAICYGLVFGIIVGVLSTVLSGSAGIAHLVQFAFQMPLKLYFEPLITVIGITVLSNYYQYVLQNKKELYSSL